MRVCVSRIGARDACMNCPYGRARCANAFPLWARAMRECISLMGARDACMHCPNGRARCAYAFPVRARRDGHRGSRATTHQRRRCQVCTAAEGASLRTPGRALAPRRDRPTAPRARARRTAAAERMYASTGLTPAACTRTSTCVAVSAGSATADSSCITEGAPNARTTIAADMRATEFFWSLPREAMSRATLREADGGAARGSLWDGADALPEHLRSHGRDFVRAVHNAVSAAGKYQIPNTKYTCHTGQRSGARAGGARHPRRPREARRRVRRPTPGARASRRRRAGALPLRVVHHAIHAPAAGHRPPLPGVRPTRCRL